MLRVTVSGKESEHATDDDCVSYIESILDADEGLQLDSIVHKEYLVSVYRTTKGRTITVTHVP
jgi:hypothetical protein